MKEIIFFFSLGVKVHSPWDNHQFSNDENLAETQALSDRRIEIHESDGEDNVNGKAHGVPNLGTMHLSPANYFFSSIQNQFHDETT